MLDHRGEQLESAADLLRHAGHRVVHCGSVEASEDAILKGGFDVAILDPLVCKAGGVEFGMLEALQRDCPIPVIVLTENEGCLRECHELRAPLRDVIRKPTTAAEIAHRVRFALAALRHVRSLHQRLEELECQVTNDFKTDLLSERHFRNLLNIEFKRSQRSRAPLSLLLIDVDNFKRINDTTDYAFGDEVLRHVAETLKTACRTTDFPARFGGDEFVVLLPQTSQAEAMQTALRIRSKIAEVVVRNERYSTKISISIGIDTYDGVMSSSPAELRRRANMALHEAKARGKDQAWLFDGGGEGKAPQLPTDARS